MITRQMTRVALVGMLAAAFMTLLHAQGRGGGEWTTSGLDAQRTAWLRADARLTQDAVQKGEFQFLWKMKFEHTTGQPNSLTAPVLLDRLIGYRGFKSLAFFGGADDRVFSIDTDLARPYWTTVLNYAAATGGQPPASWECPGGLVAMPSRRTALAPSAFGAGTGGGGRGGVRNGSAVGEPGKGAAVLSEPPPQRGGGAGAGGGRAGEGRGGRAGAPSGRGAQPAGRGPAPIGFGGVDPVFAMGSDGYLHTLLASNGADAEPPVPFLPPDTKPSALIWVDGVVFTTTSGECGGVPNAVWAMDLTAPQPERKPMSWKTGGASIAGSSGLAFGTDGTLYVAIGTAAPRASSGGHADAIVALDRQTLKLKDWFTAPGADFNATPIVVRYKETDLIAATANDGRLYLLDSASLGGADHKTPLAVSGRFTAAGAGAGLATFEDQGTRWVLATAVGAASPDVTFTDNGLAPNGRIVAFRVVDEDGKVSLAPGWQSRDLSSPLAPIVVNGMVFAASSGEYPAATALTAAERAQRSLPAVLYVIDAASGMTMWSSGTTITSFARAGLSAGGGQVYLVTYDNHLYAFGIPMEH